MKFNFFKKSGPVIPDFENLKKSPIKDAYFYRARQWFWHTKDMITIKDYQAARMVTLDPWPQMIFLDATSLHILPVSDLSFCHPR